MSTRVASQLLSLICLLGGCVDYSANGVDTDPDPECSSLVEQAACEAASHCETIMATDPCTAEGGCPDYFAACISPDATCADFEEDICGLFECEPRWDLATHAFTGCFELAGEGAGDGTEPDPEGGPAPASCDGLDAETCEGRAGCDPIWNPDPCLAEDGCPTTLAACLSEETTCEELDGYLCGLVAGCFAVIDRASGVTTQCRFNTCDTNADCPEGFTCREGAAGQLQCL